MLILLVGIIVVVVGFLVISQRKLVHMDENCYNALSQIGVQENARWEAVNALVKMTKDYSEYEYKTLMDVVNQRQPLKSGESVEKINTQAKLIDEAVSKVHIISESYPELKLSDVYIKTMESLNEYEDQVRYSQMVYNDTVTKFNRLIRQLPTSLVAGILGFGRFKDYLDYDEKTQGMPHV